VAEERRVSQAELLEALRHTQDTVLSALAALPEEHLDEGRYENGWNGRQILAHIAAIEWTFPRLLDLPARQAATAAGESPARPPVEGGIDAYNARQVAKREGMPVMDLIREFEQNRVATIAAVQTADEALFDAPITSAGGITGRLGDVMYAVAVEHILQHARDITGQDLQ
jgi:uncharacterized damage-inducible protein DinB